MNHMQKQWTRRVLAAAVGATIGVGAIAAQSARAETPDQWYQNGQQAVEDASKLVPNNSRAKNVILFVGDGLGVSTVTASRILEGQLNGSSGEENALSFEGLPYLALSKTYSVNQQVSDSAPTMTAMVTGVKTEDGILAVDQDVVRGDHTTVAGNELLTILEQCEAKGLSTGIVSTARITHATPAACYAHAPERDWESDSNLPLAARQAGFKDIARQLVEQPFGDGLEVALGGGRSAFLGTGIADPEDAGRFGNRLDGRNLAAEWASRPGAAYVWNKAQFDAINPVTTKKLLGLFERSHMEYEHDRPTDTAGEPSIAEMTAKAIDMLQTNNKGYFLMVEAGRIDHAHHAGNAYRALTDTIAMSDAVRTAMEKVNLDDTLIIVTADHSHVFTIAGYPGRGNPILGKVSTDGGATFETDLLGLPYTTLGYTNGPGYTGTSNQQPAGIKSFPHSPNSYVNGALRPDLTSVDTAAANFMPEATVPLGSETHAGEDVAIYAGGPGSHLFHGTMEQNVIYHVMAKAIGLK